ncbi:hypothetical protein M569_17723 [Genlisea aurea]|uniref:Uncharacterized protein n=1 Tax=Genlisea aurea TaxID=192259 RepID=S8BY56_9LAMI|nr:hypothetical protein M569_17723 [Genlisea aurea]
MSYMQGVKPPIARQQSDLLRCGVATVAHRNDFFWEKCRICKALCHRLRGEGVTCCIAAWPRYEEEGTWPPIARQGSDLNRRGLAKLKRRNDGFR